MLIVSTPTWSRTRTKPLGGACAVRYTIGTFLVLKGRRLDSHQHQPVYKTGELSAEQLKLQQLTQTRVEGLAPSLALLLEDPDLVLVIQAWSRLSLQVRTAILAMIDAARQ